MLVDLIQKPLIWDHGYGCLERAQAGDLSLVLPPHHGMSPDLRCLIHPALDPGQSC
jgi:hypothetical protein